MTGKTVRLSAIGRAKYKNSKHNPHDLEGTDEGQKAPEDWAHWVRWSNGEFNEYKAGEVEEVE